MGSGNDQAAQVALVVQACPVPLFIDDNGCQCSPADDRALFRRSSRTAAQWRSRQYHSWRTAAGVAADGRIAEISSVGGGCSWSGSSPFNGLYSMFVRAGGSPVGGFIGARVYRVGGRASWAPRRRRPCHDEFSKRTVAGGGLGTIAADGVGFDLALGQPGGRRSGRGGSGGVGSSHINVPVAGRYAIVRSPKYSGEVAEEAKEEEAVQRRRRRRVVLMNAGMRTGCWTAWQRVTAWGSDKPDASASRGGGPGARIAA